MMDSLNGKLTTLKLIRSRPHSPDMDGASTLNAGGNIPMPAANVQSNFQQTPYPAATRKSNLIPNNGASIQNSNVDGSPKNVGPTVPPKPQKQMKLPEVPQSILVTQASEPLYSKRLQRNGTRLYSNSNMNSILPSRPPIVFRKQQKDNVLNSKLNKVSLDNPEMLEQQLEALAHHKMQLEKKGLLQQHQHQKKPLSIGANENSNLPTLQTGTGLSLKNDSNLNYAASKRSNNVYTNVIRCKLNSSDSESNIETTNFYKNTQLKNPKTFDEKNDLNPTCGVYYNVMYKNDAVIEESSNEPAEYVKNINEDDIPPPPSPVSSSYSELRRATDIFSKVPAPVPMQQRLFCETNHGSVGCEPRHCPQYIKEGDTVNGKFVGGINSQQTYMNYNHEYSGFNDIPSSQSISQRSSDFYGYGSFSQASSTYESIYEPINPRPSSQLSTRSNYLMYVNAPQAVDCAGSSILSTNSGNRAESTDLADKHQNPKEVVVNTLTNFLVHSMDAGNEFDNYGVCVKCNERVAGENSGCTAMDKIYHITCFTCLQCQVNLQGKPFYTLEGNPYCEYDYLQTLEKCSICMKPILERILRATGKPYHPQCFTCVMCGNSLDGIPFTVDATNQNYCIADFHKKFAPRCCVCKQPIMPEPGQEETVRVVALDRSFHFECYKCEDCGLLLSSEAEGRGCYPLDDHVLCKSCNAKRVQMLTNRMTTEL